VTVFSTIIALIGFVATVWFAYQWNREMKGWYALALSAVGSSTPTLAKFDPTSDRQRWRIELP